MPIRISRVLIMMNLYSGTTCPFSHRCRIVLYEKGMDFQVIDVDLFNKPEDIAIINPYNRVPVLVERDLILYEPNIINEYIDERFPHPQLMPADPIMRAGPPTADHHGARGVSPTSNLWKRMQDGRQGAPASFATA
jgi:glutaredoxin